MSLLLAGYSIAALIPAINFTDGSGDSNCSAPSANLTRAAAEVLSSQSPALLCLNGVGSGVVNSTWQSNLSNYTTFHNGTSTLGGCSPVPNQTGCEFYASNRYTGRLPEWDGDAPTNSSTIWHPNETGYVPNDHVFVILLSFNRSTVRGGIYSFTIYLDNATPVPVTFYVKVDPARWSGSANLSITFDTTAAWTTLAPSSGGQGTPVTEVVPSISGFRLSGTGPPCSMCSVTFTESGLPESTRWYVNITAGLSHSSTISMLTADFPNGTYTYSASSANRSYSARVGSFAVDGAAVAISVPFSLVTYSVTFRETGLPAGSNWSVAVEGTTLYSTTTTDTWSVPNASYRFTVGSPSGYTANRSSGTVTVNGANTSVPLTFVASPPASTFLGLPTAEGYAVVVTGLVAAVAAGVAVGWYRATNRRRS